MLGDAAFAFPSQDLNERMLAYNRDGGVRPIEFGIGSLGPGDGAPERELDFNANVLRERLTGDLVLMQEAMRAPTSRVTGASGDDAGEGAPGGASGGGRNMGGFGGYGGDASNAHHHNPLTGLSVDSKVEDEWMQTVHEIYAAGDDGTGGVTEHDSQLSAQKARLGDLHKQMGFAVPSIENVEDDLRGGGSAVREGYDDDGDTDDDDSGGGGSGAGAALEPDASTGDTPGAALGTTRRLQFSEAKHGAAGGPGDSDALAPGGDGSPELDQRSSVRPESPRTALAHIDARIRELLKSHLMVTSELEAERNRYLVKMLGPSEFGPVQRKQRQLPLPECEALFEDYCQEVRSLLRWMGEHSHDAKQQSLVWFRVWAGMTHVFGRTMDVAEERDRAALAANAELERLRDDKSRRGGLRDGDGGDDDDDNAGAKGEGSFILYKTAMDMRVKAMQTKIEKLEFDIQAARALNKEYSAKLAFRALAAGGAARTSRGVEMARKAEETAGFFDTVDELSDLINEMEDESRARQEAMTNVKSMVGHFESYSVALAPKARADVETQTHHSGDVGDYEAGGAAGAGSDAGDGDGDGHKHKRKLKTKTKRARRHKPVKKMLSTFSHPPEFVKAVPKRPKKVFKPMPETQLIGELDLILCEKAKADRKGKAHTVSLAAFTNTFFLFRYGLRTLAHSRLHQLVASIKRAGPACTHPIFNIYTRLTGLATKCACKRTANGQCTCGAVPPLPTVFSYYCSMVFNQLEPLTVRTKRSNRRQSLAGEIALYVPLEAALHSVVAAVPQEDVAGEVKKDIEKLANIMREDGSVEQMTVKRKKLVLAKHRLMGKLTGLGGLSIRQMFERVDADGSGLITAAEFLEFAHTLDAGLTDKEAASLYKLLDADGNSSIDYSEFQKIFTSVRVTVDLWRCLELFLDALVKTMNREEYRLRKKFEEYDTNGDGILDLAEWTALIRSINRGASDTDIVAMFEAALNLTAMAEHDGDSDSDSSDDSDAGVSAKKKAASKNADKLSVAAFIAAVRKFDLRFEDMEVEKPGSEEPAPAAMGGDVPEAPSESEMAGAGAGAAAARVGVGPDAGSPSPLMSRRPVTPIGVITAVSAFVFPPTSSTSSSTSEADPADRSSGGAASGAGSSVPLVASLMGHDWLNRARATLPPPVRRVVRSPDSPAVPVVSPSSGALAAATTSTPAPASPATSTDDIAAPKAKPSTTPAAASDGEARSANTVVPHSSASLSIRLPTKDEAMDTALRPTEVIVASTHGHESDVE